MAQQKQRSSALALLYIALLLAGCNLAPVSEPFAEMAPGPLGTPAKPPVLLPLTERLGSAPQGLYQLEQQYGQLFAAINYEDWASAQELSAQLPSLWQSVEPLLQHQTELADKNKRSITQLQAAVLQQSRTDCHTALTEASLSLRELGEAYKRSPFTDIAAVDQATREVAFYLAEQDWKKAGVKAHELEITWKQVKNSMESLGILQEVIKAHAAITQLSDAVSIEDMDLAKKELEKVNTSLARIHHFYQ